MTQRPNIELRNIDVHVGLSEETPAYTAKLFVDGKHFADVSNQGHGGPDMVYSPEGIGKGYWIGDEILKTLNDRVAASYPVEDLDVGIHGKTIKFTENLETICHGLVWEHVDKRNLKSRLSRKIFIMDKDEKIYTIKGKKSPRLIEAIAKRYPDAIILNTLAFEEAWTLWRKITLSGKQAA